MFKKIFFSICSLFLLVFISGCQNDAKIKKDEIGENPNNFEKVRTYNWSTMNEGPYNDVVSLAIGSSPLYFIDDGTILAEHASVPGGVFWQDQVWLYFVDVTQDGLPEQTGYITSADGGQTWTERSFANIKGLGDKVAVDPDPFVAPNNEIWLYYLDILSADDPNQTNTIYLATSSDGVNFTEVGPVFEYEGVFDPDVLYVDGTYYLYTGNMEGNKVLVATSQTGKDFVYQQVALTGGIIPNAYYQEKTGKYYLYTGGIEIWESGNGLTYSRTGEFFSSQNGMTADPSLIEIDQDTYLMIYKTSSKENKLNECVGLDENFCENNKSCQPVYAPSFCSGEICTTDLVYKECIKYE